MLSSGLLIFSKVNKNRSRWLICLLARRYVAGCLLVNKMLHSICFSQLRVTELFYPMSYKMSLAAFKLGNLSVSIFFLLCSSSFDLVANLENLMVHLATILKL